MNSISQRITELKRAAEATGFQVETFGQIDQWPLIAMTRRGNSEQGRHIYLSSGIHGDEPAGPQALLELLQNDSLPREHHYYICPLLNPYGLSNGTRENQAGIDLNRDYRDFKSEEIQRHANWIHQSIQQVDICIHLHEDWESQGFYLYELNFTGGPGYTEVILRATSQHLPTETAEKIDGRAAKDGIIRAETVPEIEEGHPEAIYLQQKFGGLNYTLETPSSQQQSARVEALKAAVSVIVRST